MSEEHKRVRVRRKRSFNSMMMQRQDLDLLTVLRSESKFRWAVIALILVALMLGVMLPRIVVTTPAGFTPVLRVRGIDLLQARALRRTAEQHSAAGRIPEAIQSWYAALGNNQGDVVLVRGFLRDVSRQPRPDRRWLNSSFSQAGWLLGLTSTNTADVEIAAAALRNYGLHDWVIRHLGDPRLTLSPTGGAIYLKSLLDGGYVQEFGPAWDRLEKLVSGDPQAGLYHEAWLAGWGPAGGARAALDRLSAAGRDSTRPELQTTALQLLVVVHLARLDLPGFEAAFEALRGLHADTVTDHLHYWTLLDLSGRHDDAVTLAKAFTAPPQTAVEADLLLTTLVRLRLPGEATAMARGHLDQFTQVPRLWSNLGRLLARHGYWDELKQYAIDLRQNDLLRLRLDGYSYMLEAVAENGLRQDARKEYLLQHAASAPPRDPLLALEVAATLQRMGFPGLSTNVLRQIESSSVSNRVEFWLSLAKAANDIHQADLVLRACERLHQLEPNNATFANNHAAALLIARTDPAEAIKLTLSVLAVAPDSAIARINHALALAQNGRFAEAAAQLDTVPVDQLPALERTLWHFGRFEAELGQGRRDAAEAEVARIETRHLYPAQIEWLNSSRARLIGAPAAAPAPAPDPGR